MKWMQFWIQTENRESLIFKTVYLTLNLNLMLMAYWYVDCYILYSFVLSIPYFYCLISRTVSKLWSPTAISQPFVGLKTSKASYKDVIWL